MEQYNMLYNYYHIVSLYNSPIKYCGNIKLFPFVTGNLSADVGQTT